MEKRIEQRVTGVGLQGGFKCFGQHLPSRESRAEQILGVSQEEESVTHRPSYIFRRETRWRLALWKLKAEAKGISDMPLARQMLVNYCFRF